MVKHPIRVQGVNLKRSATQQHRPVLLQMHDNDFPSAFLRDLARDAGCGARRKIVIEREASSSFRRRPRR